MYACTVHRHTHTNTHTHTHTHTHTYTYTNTPVVVDPSVCSLYVHSTLQQERFTLHLAVMKFMSLMARWHSKVNRLAIMFANI